MTDAEWGSPYAESIVQAALGNIEISEQSCQQLWMHLARKWTDDAFRTLCDPVSPDIWSRTCNGRFIGLIATWTAMPAPSLPICPDELDLLLNIASTGWLVLHFHIFNQGE